MLAMTHLLGFGAGASGSLSLWGSYPTFNPSDKGSEITLTNGNLTAEVNGTSTNPGVRATQPFGTGKWYVEITNNTTNPYVFTIGLVNGSISMSVSGATTCYAVMTSQYGAYNQQYGTTNWFPYTGGSTWSAMPSVLNSGDVIMIAFDQVNGNLWFGRNGTWWNTSGTADPATASDPRATGISTGTSWYLCVGGYYTTYAKCTVNFGQNAFSYTPPSGFGPN